MRTRWNTENFGQSLSLHDRADVGWTTIIYELNHVIRLIGMDQKQLSPEDLEITPYYSGHSVGHWEGDALVVETAGYKDTTFLDATGAPSSDAMITVERVRKINGGRQLEDVVTVTDPEYLTRPFSARSVYDPHPDLRLDTYVCGETHRDISHIPGRHRGATRPGPLIGSRVRVGVQQSISRGSARRDQRA